MEEADARLQEVVASLLNEHGGNHEQALRQTFACLHNSGLYEAQSAAEEEQREQQVRILWGEPIPRLLATCTHEEGTGRYCCSTFASYEVCHMHATQSAEHTAGDTVSCRFDMHVIVRQQQYKYVSGRTHTAAAVVPHVL